MSGFRFPAGAPIAFLIDKASRQILGPTQPPIKWVPRLFPPKQSVRGVKLTTHLHLAPKLRTREGV